MKTLFVLVAAAALAGCGTGQFRAPEPGISMAQLESAMGQAADKRVHSDGETWYYYPRQPHGLAMFVAHAGDFIASPVFVLKLCLILAAGVNAAVFHAGVFRGASDWDVNRMPPAAARMAAALSLLLWVSVIACGRLLAYT